MEIIKTYWGGMLEIGATTFWEDFDLEWMKDASRIEELPKVGQKDIHGGYGNYCYIGFRNNFCHGWASDTTALPSKHVLGIEPIEPGFKKVKIEPDLGNLDWAEGSFPTPFGNIKVKHVMRDGKVETTYDAPPQIEVILN